MSDCRINFLPWVGARYFAQGFGGTKILLLGESHYSSKPEDSKNPELTRMIVTEHALGQKPLRFFKTLPALIAGVNRRGDLTAGQYKLAWNSLSFYNYVQDLLPAARHRPTPAMWENASKPFADILNMLKPDVVLIAGRQLSWHVPPLPDPVITVRIKHPSSFGFSYKAALSALNEKVPVNFCAAPAAFKNSEEAN